MEYSQNLNLNESQVELKQQNSQKKDSFPKSSNGRSSLILDSQKKRRNMLSPRNHPISPFQQPSLIQKQNSPTSSNASMRGAGVLKLSYNSNNYVVDDEDDDFSQKQDVQQIDNSHKSKNMGGRVRPRVESDCQSSEGRDVMMLNLSQIKIDKQPQGISQRQEIPQSPIKPQQTPLVSQQLPSIGALHSPQRKYSTTVQKPLRQQRASIAPTPFSNIQSAVNQLANDNSFLIDKPLPRVTLGLNFMSKMKNSILVNRFANKLKKLIQYQRYRLLTSNQLQRIGDTTFYASGMVENGVGQQREYGKVVNFLLLQLARIRRKILKFQRSTSRLFEEALPAINPDNNLIIIWWIFLLICIFLQIFIVPYKFFQINEIIRFIDERFQLQQRFNTIFECSKLVVFILMMAHIFGCGFHLIARLEIQAGSQDTWVQKQDMENSGNGERYIAAIYYTIVTMITIGYGDITPNNSYERIYAMVMMIFTTFAFGNINLLINNFSASKGYTVNKISTLFSSRAAAEQEFLKKKYSLSKFLANKDLPHELCTKLYRNLESLHQKQNDGQELGISIFNSLQIQHQLEYKKEFFGRILANQKLLTQNFSVEAMKEVALMMEEKNLTAGEHLFVQGQYDSRIFIIVKGSLQLLHSATGRAEVPVGQLTEGRILGLADGMRNAARRVSARAQSSGTQVVYFHLEEFVRTLRKSGVVQDYEIYCNLRQEVTLNDEHSQPGQGYQCECCGQFAHTLQDCPLIHFNANRANLFSKHTYSQILKDRQPTQRRQIKKEDYKALLQIYEVRDKLVSIRKDYTELPLEYQDLSDPEDDKEFYFIYPKIKGNRIRHTKNDYKQSSPIHHQRDLHKSLLFNQKKNASYKDSQENGQDDEADNERKIVQYNSQSYSDSSSNESNDMTFFKTDTESSQSSESESQKKDTDSIISILRPKANKSNTAQTQQQLHPHLSLNAVGQQNIMQLINSATQNSSLATTSNQQEHNFSHQYFQIVSSDQIVSKVQIEGTTNVPANTITPRKNNKSPKDGIQKQTEDIEDSSNNVFDSPSLLCVQQQMQQHSSLQNSSQNNLESDTSAVPVRPAPGEKRRGSVFKLMMNKITIPNAKDDYQQDSSKYRQQNSEKNKQQQQQQQRHESQKPSSRYIQMSSQLQTRNAPDTSPPNSTFARQKSRNKSVLMQMRSSVDPVTDPNTANYFSIPNFEKSKNYKWFQPQHNIQSVLKRTQRYLARFQNDPGSQRDLANRSPEAIMSRSSLFFKIGSPKRLQVTPVQSYQPQLYQKKRQNKILTNSKGELQA